MKRVLLGFLFLTLSIGVAKAQAIYPWMAYIGSTCSSVSTGTDHMICLDSVSLQTFKCRTSDGTCTTLISSNPNVVVVTQSATPSLTITNANKAVFSITGLAQAITSVTMSGTPTNGEIVEIQITDNGVGRAISLGSSFVSSTVTLPTTTVASTMISIVVQYDSTSTKWICKGVA